MMTIYTLSLTITICFGVFHGYNTLQYGNRLEPLYKSIKSPTIAKKSKEYPHYHQQHITSSKSFHFPTNVFGSILNSPSSAITALSSQIDSASPVSLTIAMKLQPKKRYRKFKLPDTDGSSDDGSNPIMLSSHQINSAVGLLLKRTGHLNEISTVKSTRKPKYRVSKISVPSKGQNRQQSALAKFEIRRQKNGLQSKPTEPTLLPLQLTNEKPHTSGVFRSNRKRKVKLAKQNISLVGSLITAPPSDKSKLTIPKQMSDWSDRRTISNQNRLKVTTPRTIIRPKPTLAVLDEITVSSSKKSESTLYSGKILKSPTTSSAPFEVKPKSLNSQKQQIGPLLIKHQQPTSVNMVRNLGNHGAVLLASGQLGQTNKSKITRIPLEPLDYETELDKNHSDNLMEKSKQLGPYELSPFSYIETAANENVDRIGNSQDPLSPSPSYFTRSPINKILSNGETISKPSDQLDVSTPSTTSNYNDFKRNGFKNREVQVQQDPQRSVSNFVETRRSNIIKYDYGHFGERMVPLRQSDSSSTSAPISTTPNIEPTTAPVIATNQPAEPSNVYFDSNPTPSSNEILDPELDTVRENDINGQVTTTTADPLIEGNLVTGSTVTPWSWDDSPSSDVIAGDDGLLVSPLFASTNDDDVANQEIHRNQNYQQTSPQEFTTSSSLSITEPPVKNQERMGYTKLPNSDDESNGRDTTRYFFPFELKYLAELCKNSSAFGQTNSIPSTMSTIISTTTTTPRPTSVPVEELTVERSQVDEATLSYGDRPIGRGRKNRYNMKKVAYQYKQWGNSLGRQSSLPPTETPHPNERRYKSAASLFSPHKRRPEQTTTTTTTSTINLESELPIYNESPTEAPKEEEETEVKDELKTTRPMLVRHEYRYEAPFGDQDHGSHGEPIGTRHFVEDVDLKATETTEPLKSKPNANENDGVSIDEDKKLFENFELPFPRLKPKSTVQEDERSTSKSQEGGRRKTTQELELNLDESSSKSPSSSSKDESKSSNAKKYPPSKTLENSGGLSSSILDELAGIPGGAGRDYPALHKIPEEVDFSCKGRASGFYADMNLRCQVYHHCNHGSVQSFICPNGTIFNQEISVCSWWFNVDCSKSEQFYELNSKPRPDPTKPPTVRPVNPSVAPDNNSSRHQRKNRIIYKQSPALEESFFRETPRSSYLTNQYYNNRSRRRHRYHHHQNSDDLFPFF